MTDVQLDVASHALGRLERSDSVYSLLCELESPPRLSFVKKAYYYVRPLLPLWLRHNLQGARRVEVGPRWFVSERLIEEYINRLGRDALFASLESLWPDGAHAAISLTHDVESRKGLDFVPRVIELEHRYHFHSSWNLVPFLYPIDGEIVDLIRSTGNEVGIHGYNHDGKLYFSRRIFDFRSTRINAALKKYGAVGFRSPAVHRNLMWLQDLEIEYDASCFDIDPFQPMPGGTHSIWPFQAGKFVELPYTLPQDHVLWIQLKEKSNRIWEEKTRWLYDHHGMILLITHPDYLMVGDNMKRYEDLLDVLSHLSRVWRTLPRDLARFWRKKIPKVEK